MTIATGQNAVAADFVSTSAGAGDSGKGVKLNASGKLDKTFINLSLSDVTGSRANNTAYQNTSGGPMFVTAYITGDRAMDINGYVENNATPTQRVIANETTTDSGARAGVSFMVPPGFYYKIVWANTGGGSTSLGGWFEYVF